MPFPFLERDRVRIRPALIISRPLGPENAFVWTLMVTSADRGAWPGDVAVGPHHDRYGLPVPCAIRTAKIAALDIASIESKMGRLSTALLDQVNREVRSYLGF